MNLKALALLTPLLSVVGLAQTLTLIPVCGKPGDKVCITGSGWAEPDPVCRYTFTFNGATVAPDQPDGLFGPPRTNFNVPAGTADGTYNVRVQLRLNFPDQLLQERTSPFKVVSAGQDPWTQATGTGGTMRVTFNPSGVCDVGPCKKIVFIQVIEQLGVKADGTTRSLTFAEQGFPNPAALDADVAGGKTVDYTAGEADPYYNGDDPGDIGTQGSQSATPTSATTNDTPQRSPGFPNIPADVVSVRLNFEVAAFCASGESAGKFLGRMLWSWTKTRAAAGTLGTISGISTDRGQPSAGFLAALTKWNTNHAFKLPTMKAVACP